MFSLHPALLGRDKLKAPTSHPSFQQLEGYTFFGLSCSKGQVFGPWQKKRMQITNFTPGAVPPPLRTLCTYGDRHTRHNNRRLDPQFHKTSPSVQSSVKRELHTSCTYTHSKPWYGSHRSRFLSLSQRHRPCTQLEDSTPKANRQTKVAFRTCLVDN